MVTVEVSRADYKPNSVEVLSGWLSSDKIVVPRTVIYPEGQTAEEANQQNTAMFDDSEDQAITAALAAKGIKPVRTEVVVDSVTPGSPADGKLQAQDVIDAVDGKALVNPDDVHTLIQKHKPGETVVFTVTRAGKQQQIPVVTTQSHDSGPSRTLVGFLPGTQNVFPFSVKIQLDNVGGPSAGMMFALGIIDKLTPGQMTGGKHFAGTGTIDPDGKVGPIGGIAQKMIGASESGAKVFLAPAANCGEVVGHVPDGLQVVKVSTLKEAVNAVTLVGKGKDAAALPSCG
jgi:PDZ domain-containing protein